MTRTKTLKIPTTICGNSPFIKVNFENQELTFLVDTGAYGSLIDKKYIKLPEGEEVKEETLVGFGNSQVAGISILLFFSIENERLCCPMTVTDVSSAFKNFKKALGEIAGIIGGEFLNGYEAIIDYGASEIHIKRKTIKTIMKSMSERLKAEGGTL